MPEQADKAARGMAIAATAATLVLILAGGFVTTTETGDTIPDWPKSWGRIEGGAWVEWTHRALAAVVGALVLAVALRVQLRVDRRSVRTLAWAAFGAVLVQAALGGARVLHLLPRSAAALVHAVLGQAVFCAVAAVAVLLSRRWVEAKADPEAAGAAPMAAVTFGFAFLQLVAGAVTRHTGAGLWIHIGNAFVVVVLVALTGSRLFGTSLRKGALHLIKAVSLQLILGFVALGITQSGFERSAGAPVWKIALVTLHVALGAAVLAASLALALRCRRAAAAEPAGLPEGARA